VLEGEQLAEGEGSLVEQQILQALAFNKEIGEHFLHLTTIQY
jgi:hypothetical protein